MEMLHVGWFDGKVLGELVGRIEGIAVGLAEGETVGLPEGLLETVGTPVGLGLADGSLSVTTDGASVFCVGTSEGVA